jgi:hypothetical protein
VRAENKSQISKGAKTPSVQQLLFMEASPSPLSSRGIDLPAASQGWNERQKSILILLALFFVH